MARPGLRNHPKFKRLLAMLRIPEAHAYGHLQMLWDAAYEFGEDIGDSVDVEINAGWSGEPGTLCKSLSECAGSGRDGFIEPIPDKPGHWRIHDLYDHAPKYVQKRMEREASRMQKGQTISDLRRAAAHEMHKRKNGSKGDASENHLQPDAGKNMQMVPPALQVDANGPPPAPSPAPAPSPKVGEVSPTTPLPESGSALAAGAAPRGVVEGVPEGVPKRPRKPKVPEAQRLGGFHPEVAAMVQRLKPDWPKQREDGSRLDNDSVDTCAAVQRILRDYPDVTLAELEDAARDWLAAKKPYPNGMPFWFGPGKRGGEDPPWKRAVMALRTTLPDPVEPPEQVPA